MNSEEKYRIKKELDELFSDTSSNAYGDKSFISDVTEKERKEAEDYLKSIRQEVKEKAPKSPSKRWQWTYIGRLILKGLILLVEFIIIAFLIICVLPFAINTSITIFQGITGSFLLMVFKQWWK